MKFPLSWLKEIIPTKKSPEEIASILTAMGLEVESMQYFEEEVVLEVGITPNLSYAANVIGIAKEISAVTSDSLVLPPISLQEKAESKLAITMEAPELCERYSARCAFDVEVKESPPWLKKRLELSGVRSINNIVDITNYVMQETGQPLHAFDYDKIQDAHLIVRRAKKGEKITTLEDKEYFLTEDILVIADTNAPLAIAGIMGGKHAEVSQNTKRVVIEAAYFEPKSIRRASKKLGIQTQASYHFERGVDPNGLDFAEQRAATLLQSICGAKISKPLEKHTKIFPQKVLSCRLQRVNKILGIHLALSEAETIFKRLGFTLVSSQNDTITVSVPTNRVDLSYEIDLIEEIARLYGYDNLFHKEHNIYYQGSKIPSHPMYGFGKKICQHLLSEGLQQLLTCNLIGPQEAESVTPSIFPSRSLIKILNPTSIAHSVMRPSLLPNVLQVVKENQDHNIFSLAGFEMGKIHFKLKERFIEPLVLSIVLTGDRAPFYWDRKSSSFDFFDLKGILENLFSELKIEKREYIASKFDHFHPGRQAQVLINGQQEVGIMGEIHPAFLQKMGLHQPIYFAELNLDDLIPYVKKEVRMKKLPLFPSSLRDFTFPLSDKQSMQEVFNWIEKDKPSILEEVLVLDLYQSDKLGSEVKNVTLRFVYRDLEKTVLFEEVEKEHDKIVSILKKRLNSNIRG